MQVLRILTLALLATAACRTAAAQPGPLGNWFMYFNHTRLRPTWGVWTEGQYRNYNIAGDLEQFFVRTALTRDLPGTGVQFALGYGFFRSANYIGRTDRKRYGNENRVYQQMLVNQRFGRLYLFHRYRLEERFLADAFKWRFRYLLGTNICLNRPDRSAGAVYLSLYNELFIQPAAPVFDRTRVYGALGYVFGPQLRMETGLMYQLFENKHRPQWQVAAFHTLDFSARAD